MKEFTKNDFESQLDVITDIVIRANNYYYDIVYLLRPDSEEEKNISKHNEFIKRVKFSFWVLTILDLCKIFGSDKEDFQIIKFLNDINNSGNSLNLNKDCLNKINDWVALCNDSIVIDLVKKIKTLRDNYYAHNDKKAYKDISFLLPIIDDVGFLIEFAKEIVYDLNSIVLDKYVLGTQTGSKRNSNGILNQIIRSNK